MKTEEIATELIIELESIGADFHGFTDRAHILIKRRLRAAYSAGASDAYDHNKYTLTPR